MMGVEAGFFEQDIAHLARALIGATLLVDGTGGVIVETEAYDTRDPASHSFAGPTRRNASMFGPPVRAYIYRIYGAHWCLNVVGGSEAGAAVLIRALEPTCGIDLMAKRRGTQQLSELCSGPGKLCEALGVTGGALDGAPLSAAPFHLKPPAASPPLVCGPRVGVNRAPATPWALVGADRSSSAPH